MNTLKAKIANARKSRILIIAWRIRKDAAAKYNCNPTKILMKECVEQAWKIEKHAEQQPIQIRKRYGFCLDHRAFAPLHLYFKPCHETRKTKPADRCRKKFGIFFSGTPVSRPV